MKTIVIGSVIVGASAAYLLAKNDTDVIMVDKEHQGNATSAGAGIVCPWISSVKDKDWYRIAKGGAHYYPELIAQLKEDGEHDVGYKKVGALAVNSDSEKLDEIENRARARQKDAPEMGDITRLRAVQTRERFPLLDKDLESVFVSGAARVDGRLLRNALKRAAQKDGGIAIIFRNITLITRSIAQKSVDIAVITKSIPQMSENITRMSKNIALYKNNLPPHTAGCCHSLTSFTFRIKSIPQSIANKVNG